MAGGGWQETLWRYREGYDPYVPKGAKVAFYGNKDGRANIISAPYEPPAEAPDAEYDMWMGTGRARTLALWLDDAASARTVSCSAGCPCVYESGGRAEARFEAR